MFPLQEEMSGEQVLPLAGLLEASRSAGWRVIHMGVASRLEWDDFESTSRAGRQVWLRVAITSASPCPRRLTAVTSASITTRCC